MVIDIDERLASTDMIRTPAETLKRRTIRGDDNIKLTARSRFFHAPIRIEKAEFIRDHIFIPNRDFLARIFEGHREAQFGADTVTIGPNVPHNAHGTCFFKHADNLINDFRTRFHTKIFSP